MSLSDLRSSTKTIRQWLANVRAELVNFRYEMTRELKTFGEHDEQKVAIYSLISLAEDAIDNIDDIYTSLKTLSVTPPGLASGVIDFAYMILSGRVIETEKSKYRAKLNDLRSSMLRQRLRVVEKNMGFKEGGVEAFVEGLSSKYGLGPQSRAELIELGQLVLDPDEETTPERVQQKVQQLQSVVSTESAGKATKLSELVRDLKAKLAELAQAQNTPQAEKNRIVTLLENIKLASVSSNYTLKFSAADYAKFLQDLKEWQALFYSRIMDSKKHLSKIEAEVSNVSKEESTLAAKYLNLYRAFLGEHNPRGITSLLKQMADRIRPIIAALSAIDNKDNDRETLSKKPESAQPATEKEEEKPQSTQNGQ